MNAAPKTTEKSKQRKSSGDGGFTAEERAAMKDRAAELRAAKRRGNAADKAAAEERDVLAKIADLPPADRTLAEGLHRIITTAAPELAPKLWYGMPAYAKDGKVLCHFQSAEKFGSRYAEIGFSDQASLDDGALWPVAYAVTELGASEEKKITALVKKAVG
jgi:uncharacterized protein YdhG (YjbR/CyaY superfamily)